MGLVAGPLRLYTCRVMARFFSVRRLTVTNLTKGIPLYIRLSAPFWLYGFAAWGSAWFFFSALLEKCTRAFDSHLAGASTPLWIIQSGLWTLAMLPYFFGVRALHGTIARALGSAELRAAFALLRPVEHLNRGAVGLLMALAFFIKTEPLFPVWIWGGLLLIFLFTFLMSAAFYGWLSAQFQDSLK
jgi:hypothetical protein